MKNNNRKTICMILLTMTALFIRRDIVLEGEGFLQKIAGLPIVTAALAAAALYFFYRETPLDPATEKAGSELLPKRMSLLAGIFAFFMVFGESYMRCGSWDLVFGSGGLFVLSLLMGAGYFFLFRRIFWFLERGWKRLARKKEDVSEGTRSERNGEKRTVFGRAAALFDRRPVLCSMILMLVCWAVYMTAFYPAILSPDPTFQIKQFFNEDTKYADYVVLVDENVKLTNHHPVAHSVLLGVSILAGRFLGSDNFGLFLYSLFQTLTLSGTLAYTISYMKKLGLSRKFRLGALGIYCLVPMFPFYAMSAVKDVLFTAWMILYGLLMFDMIRSVTEKGKAGGNGISVKRAAVLTALLFLLSISRNNGVHVILLSFPFLIIVMKGSRKRLLLVGLCFLALYGGYFKVLLPGLHITNGSVREMLSIPFQQTARTVRDHEKDLTEEEKKIIDKVLGYEDLAERYDPELADPVKNKYNRYAEKEDLAAYFGVWFKGLLRHPDTYIQATMNNAYGFFYPDKTKWYIYYKYDGRITENDLVDYHYNGLKGLRSILRDFGRGFPYIPLVGLLSNIGFNTWLLLYMAFRIFEKNRRKYMVALLPYLITVLICVASPANTYFRYSMPYIFAMPLMAAFFITVIKEKEAVIANEPAR